MERRNVFQMGQATFETAVLLGHFTKRSKDASIYRNDHLYPDQYCKINVKVGIKFERDSTGCQRIAAR